MAIFGLVVAGMGAYRDVAWHVSFGRDEGLFTAPHTAIVLGLWMLVGAALAGAFMARQMGVEKGLRLGGGYIPWSLLALGVLGATALAGFPLDELWHRLYGIDLTMWSPPHLLMILGASLAPLALWLVLAEAGVHRYGRVRIRGFHAATALAVLLGLSSVQGEFLFGVPQFQQLYHPTLVAIAAGLSPAPAWTQRSSGTTSTLHDVECPSTGTCYAVGASGTIRKSTSGGVSWASQSSGTSNTLFGLACPDTATCYAVGGSASSSTVRKTTNGGSSWAGQSNPSSAVLLGVDCTPTIVTRCFAAGYQGTIMRTNDGGSSWQHVYPVGGGAFGDIACPSFNTCQAGGASGSIAWDAHIIFRTLDGGNNWEDRRVSGSYSVRHHGISCPSSIICYVAGSHGEVMKTSNSGGNWQVQRPLSYNTRIYDVSCPSTSTCYAVGDGGSIISTTNGGSSWQKLNSGTSVALRGISCPGPSQCVAVGDGGVILTGPPA